MNPEQQCIAIAEACGWTAKEDKDGFWRAVDPSGNMTHKLWISESNVWSAGIPDYLEDLNAMHEAEKTLTKKQLQTYLDILADAPRESMYQTWSTSVFATAAQRAEAFLRTIGKWKEVQ